MSEELRFSVPGDEPGLKELWKSVYNDDTRMDGFFEAVYTPGMAALCLRDGEIVSAAYVLRVGDLVADGRWTPCRAVYALGTRPDCRRQGLAGRVLGLATQALGSAGVIVPGSGDLIPFCRKYGFEPAFSAAVQDCTDVGIPLNGSVTRVTVRGYAALREELLHQTPHIDFDLKLLSCQEEILRRENGGFYYVVAEGQRCCAAASLREGRAYIPELIVPSGSRYNAAALVARALRSGSFTYRTPARPGEELAPCALLAGQLPRSPAAPWYGLCLD